MIEIKNDKLENILLHKYESALKSGYKGNFDNFVTGKLYSMVSMSYPIDLHKIEKGLSDDTLNALDLLYDKKDSKEGALVSLINNKDRYIDNLITKLKAKPLNKLKSLFNK